MTDVFSWGDSDPFEEDDSWMSEPESVCNNWRGWKKLPSTPGAAGAGVPLSAFAGASGSGPPGSGPSAGASSSGIGNYSAALNGQLTGANSGPLAASLPTNVVTGLGATLNSTVTNGGLGGLVAGLNPHRPSSPTYEILNSSLRDGSTVLSLTELAARVVASYIPFEVVQRFPTPVPEPIQLRIAFWSFPDNEEDIRLYSCLANGSADEFQKGEGLFKNRAVQSLLQIGFHLSATVVSPAIKPCTVAVAFDRGRITSCSCTCNCTSSWCSHVVAVCLHRIYQPVQVSLRAPVTESLSRLDQTQLQKFAQYLINEFPQQILPTAQRLLDDLLNPDSSINQVWGAPDPTAGALIHDQTKWCLDENQLHDNIRKIVIKLCIPSPIVYSDVNYLSSTAPPAASEWTSLLRPLRGREPEGLWNLLSIVREMLRRHDRNYIPLLKILTEEILTCETILLWWFNTNVSLHRGYPPSGYSSGGNGGGGNRSSIHSNIHASQHACSSLCDEIVVLWRLVTLNPALLPQDTRYLYEQLQEYHLKTLTMVVNANASSRHQQNPTASFNGTMKSADIEIFSGFKPAMVSCLIDWKSYPISGVTNAHKNPYCPSINATSTSTSSCNHAISGTVKLNPPWSKVGYSKQSSSDSSGNAGSEGPDEPVKLNDSEDSGNNEAWDRASEGSSDEERPPANGQQQENAVPNVDADYQIYVYNTASGRVVKKTETEENANYEPQLVAAAQVKPIEDSFEILFSRAEALYAHGYVKEACQLSVKLAEELLNNPPVLQLEPEVAGPSQQVASTSNGLTGTSTSNASTSTPNALTNVVLANGRNHLKRAPRYRFNPALHQISLLASATLSKAAFLCQVLSEHEDSHLLAFHVGLFGLELVRPPASTKALEVKLANQEQELVNSLKRIPLCSRALGVLREKAEQLRDGRLTTRGEALLPLILASYIFDALVLSSSSNGSNSAAYNLATLHSSFMPNAMRLPTDERLGFDASVAAIGLKANVSEADHPLLCEGTRRQRGDLALTLLVHYKDNKERLNKIMDKLLDKEIHMINRKPSMNYMLGDSTNSSSAPRMTTNSTSDATNQSPARSVVAPFASSTSEAESANPASAGSNNWDEEYKTWEAKFRRMNLNDGEQTQQPSTSSSRPTKHSSPTVPTVSNSASIDSSAPETTSSDNSPTVSRRNLFIASGKTGSDSSSSGESSDSFSSTSSTEKKVNRSVVSAGSSTHHLNHGGYSTEVSFGDLSHTPPSIVDLTNGQSRGSTFESFNPAYMASWSNSGPMTNNSPAPMMQSAPNYVNCQRMPNNNNNTNGLKSNGGPYSAASCGNLSLKPLRYKGKRGHYPIIPNQPSEASAHFMFELAKTVLAKAGGTNTSVLFTQPPSSQNCRAHRNLHMCAFQIGLYALGLHNTVSPNWLSRTYSSQVSWITSQAFDIGHQAIAFLIDTWEGHFTPNEVASLADRASRGQEQSMVLAAAQLSLSCLPHAHALTPSEIQRALIQCKEQSSEMLERACLAVESAAQGGGVYPEVLFHVARKWHELYENEVRVGESSNGNRRPSGGNNNAAQAQGPGQQQLPRCCTPEAHPEEQPPPMVPANAEQQNQISPEFMYFNEAAVYGAAFAEVFNDQAATVEMANGAPIVLNSPNGSAQNSVQLYQGPPMYPATMFQGPFSNAGPFGPGPNLRYYPNSGTFSANMVAAIQQSAAANGRYYGPPTPYGYPVNGQQAPMLPFSYAPNFYHPMMQSQNMNGKQPMGPPTPSFYYPQMNGSQGGPGASTMRTNTYLLPQPGTNMYPMPPGPYPYLNYPNGTYLGGQGHPANVHQSQSNTNSQSIHLSPRQLGYMHAVYRVGMLAMDTLARRVNDDRPQTKYARNPFYCEDVKWLLLVAKKLGSSYVQDFCLCSANAVGSPFVLYEIITEAAQSLAHCGPSNANSPYLQTIRSQLLTPLIHKCQQLFSACIYFQILHITTGEYDEFLSTIRSARLAFQLLPGGNLHFNELMQSLKRTKTCKKELWQHITNVMQSTN